MRWSELNILVTGGAGFIGSHLCSHLIKQKHHVTVIDNFDSYYSRNRKEQQLEQVKRAGHFQFYKIELLSAEKCMEVFQKKRFDVVIHLAALPGVAYSVKHPLSYVDYNIKATINVLKGAGETAVPHVVFASSSSVYGNLGNQPLKEEMANGNVLSPYAASKYGAESFCHSFQHLYGFRLSILRFFTVYGPWARPDMAIPKFAYRLSKGLPVEVYGKGSARDYTYIDDIVAGINAVLQTDHQNETFNLGFGKPVPINTLLEIFQEYFPNMELVEKPWRAGDVEITWADISKAKELLGYSPKVTIEEGINRTIRWVKGLE